MESLLIRILLELLEDKSATIRYRSFMALQEIGLWETTIGEILGKSGQPLSAGCMSVHQAAEEVLEKVK